MVLSMHPKGLPPLPSCMDFALWPATLDTHTAMVKLNENVDCETDAKEGSVCIAAIIELEPTSYCNWSIEISARAIPSPVNDFAKSWRAIRQDGS